MLLIIACLFMISSAFSADLVTKMISETNFLSHWDLVHVDTGTGLWDKICGIDKDLFWPGSMAVAPDGTIFMLTKGEPVWDTGHTAVIGYATRIWQLDPTVDVSGSIAYTLLPDPVYERVHGIDEPDIIGVYLTDIAVRYDPVASRNVLFFSIACGGCEDDISAIYYINEFGTEILYYHVNRDEMGTPSCPSSRHWSGQFSFDDSNNLYLSSGNHLPASIFVVTGAGMAPISETDHIPDQIWEDSGPISDMAVIGTDLYYTDWINIKQYDLTGAAGAAVTVFTNPHITHILDLDAWPTALAVPTSAPPPETGGTPEPEPDHRMFPGMKKGADPGIMKLGTGKPRFIKNKYVVPVNIAVKNLGSKPSGLLKIQLTARYAAHKKDVAMPMHVLNQHPVPYITLKSLSPFQEIILTRNIILDKPESPGLNKNRVTITATLENTLKAVHLTDQPVMDADPSNNSMQTTVVLK